VAEGDERVGFKLDLDAQDAIKKLLETKGIVLELGDSKNLDGLISGLMTVGPIAAGLAAVFFALKTTMDTVFDAENIKQINAQFELMTQQAGIATNTLKEGLLEASHGLIDDTDLLRAANKALVEMGDRAGKLPEIMEAARKSTAVMGGDLISNFEAINQAISTGQTRMLRSQGIIVDQKKAYETYAKSINLTVGELSLAGRQQAILDAVLANSQKNFKGVNADLKENTNLWQQLKTTINNIKEVIVLAFEKVAGPVMSGFLKTINKVADTWRTELTAKFGEGSEQASASVIVLQKDIAKLAEHLTWLNEREKQSQGWMGKIFGNPEERAAIQKDIDATTQKIVSLHEELEKSRAASKPEASPEEIKGKDSSGDVEAQRKQKAEFEKELDAAREKRLNDEMSNTESIQRVHEIADEQRLQMLSQTMTRIDELEANNNLHADQRRQLEEEAWADYHEKLAAMQEREEQQKAAALDRGLAHSQRTSASFAQGWNASAKQATNSVKQFTNTGVVAQKAFQKASITAFKAIGEGAKSAGDIMKQFMFGAMADIAEQKGEYHLIEGFASENYAEVAGGAALLALSGFLRSQAGGGGGGGASSGISAPSGGETGPGAAAASDTPAAPALAAKKEMTLNIHGNYFDTDQTRTRLMEIMRESQDITDFNLVKIGQS
jgi:hypothetical protein